MKAIILAAGKSERLGRFAEKIPKPMIEVNGKPILQHNIELCKKNSILDLFINVHYLPMKIIEYFKNGSNFGVHIDYSLEKELLGTSGSVREIIEDFDDFDENFFVIYGDNYHENIDFNALIKKSEETDSIATILFHYREDTQHSGVAEFDEDCKIVSFAEKPKQTKSRWVNASVYYLSPKIINYIPHGVSDFSKDIFPRLLEEDIPIYGVCTNSIVRAFDTPEMLKQNNVNLD